MAKKNDKLNAGDEITVGFDMTRVHVFDKDTELTILEGEGTKAYVPVVELERQAKRAEEERILAEEIMKNQAK